MTNEPAHLTNVNSRFASLWLSGRLGLLAISVLLAGLSTWWLVVHSGVPREAGYMGGIFVLAATLWVSEALPLFATSLLVIGLQAVLLANPGNWPGLGFEDGASPTFRMMLSAVADPVLLLFFGGFVLANAATKTGVDRGMSVLLLSPFGQNPRWVLLGLMFVTLLFSMWMSNTATTAMMLAMISPMLAFMDKQERFRKALVLCIPLAANIGGMGTPIASPPNAVAVGFLQSAGFEVSFLRWMLVAVPLMLALVLLGWLVIYKFYPPSSKHLKLTHQAGRLKGNGWFVVFVFVTTVLLWLTDVWHGLPASCVALLPIIALTATGIFTRQDLGQIDWSVLILIAGGISLGYGMQLTHLDQIVVAWLPTAGSGILLLAMLLVVTYFVSSFMSNTAAANLLLPIGLSAAALTIATAVSQGVDVSAATYGLHPIQAAISIALVASISMTLPISTPPNAMAYSWGEIQTRDMVHVMLLVSVVGVVAILLGGGPIMRFWGVLP